VFSRSTAPARNVVMTAQNEARAAGNATITPAHLVLELLSESEGLAAQAIAGQGVDPATVRRTAITTLPQAVEHIPELIAFGAQA
jgi:ATP-dependent Clp protease ATP-binding subunit ClpA